MLRKTEKRMNRFGLFASALVPDDEDEQDDSSKSSELSEENERSSRLKTLRSLRLIILTLIVLMSVMSMHIYSEDLKYYFDTQTLNSRWIAMIFAMSSILLAGLGFYAVYNVRMYFVFAFAVLFTLMMVLKMNSSCWKHSNHNYNSILFHLPHFILLFCTWIFTFLGVCHFC